MNKYKPSKEFFLSILLILSSFLILQNFIIPGIEKSSLSAQIVSFDKNKNIEKQDFSKSYFTEVIQNEKDLDFLKGLIKRDYPESINKLENLRGIIYSEHDDILLDKSRSQYGSTQIVAKNQKFIFETENGKKYEIKNVGFPFIENFSGLKIKTDVLRSGVIGDFGIEKVFVNISKDQLIRLNNSRDNKNMDYVDRSDSPCGPDVNYCSLVVLLDYSNNSGELMDPGEIESFIENNIRYDMLEMSYGKIKYGVVVSEWIPVANPNTTPFLATVNYLSLNNPNYQDEYDDLVYINNKLPETPAAAGYFANGFTRFSISYWYLNRDISTTIFHSSDIPGHFENAYIHELGHNMGLGHDDSNICKNGPTSLPSDCVYKEYGNPYSSMGIGAGHFSAEKKKQIGWIDDDKIHTMISGENLLYPISEYNKGDLLVKINKNNEELYSLEYRRQSGLDNSIGLVPNFDGVLVYKKSRFNQIDEENYLIVDQTPQNEAWQYGPYYLLTPNPDMVLGAGSSMVDYSNGLDVGVNYQSILKDKILVSAIDRKNVCSKKNHKIFRLTGDFLTQLPQQSLSYPDYGNGNNTPNLSNIPSFIVDNTLLGEINFAFTYMFFNDDSINCPSDVFETQILKDGDVIFQENRNIEVWGQDYITVQFNYPTYNLPYGDHKVVLKVKRLSDGYTLSHDLWFNTYSQ